MSSDEEIELKQKSTTQKHPVSSDLVKKFDELKQKRARIQRRREKRLQKRETREKSSEDKEATTLNEPKESVTIPTGVYLQPNDEEKQKLDKIQKEIDVAICTGDFERAESLNDQLYEEEAKIKANKIDAAIKNGPQSQIGERKTPFWRFDSKKRWETKSNM